MGGQKVGTVPVVVTWKENGTVQKRTMQVKPGFVFDFEKSKTRYEVSQDAKKNPVLNLDKSEAYILLGATHANNKGDTDKYQLDEKDMQVIKDEWRGNEADALKTNTRVRSGTGAGYIKTADINTRNEYVIVHGKGNEYRMSIFMKK